MGRVVEPYVVEEFFAALEPEGMHQNAVPDDHETSEAQRLLAEAERELEAFLGASVADLGREVFRAGLELRQQTLDRATAAVGLLAARANAAGVPPVADLEAMWPGLEIAERRRILAAGLDAVMLRRGRDPIGDRTRFLWKGECPDDLPRRGRRVPLASFEWDSHDPGIAGMTVA
jgi:hypothetical protein